MRTDDSADRRATVRLVYDTRGGACPTGVRPVIGSGERRLHFAGGDLELFVRVSTSDDAEHLDVTGQVLSAGRPLPNAVVQIETEHECHLSTTEHAGGFWIPMPSSDGWRLAIRAGGAIFETPAIALAS